MLIKFTENFNSKYKNIAIVELINRKRIVVVGSSNTDMVIKADRLPVPGETVIGKHFMMNPGGKGANQAVAAARMGGDVSFITKTGNDLFGRQSIELYNSENIKTEYVYSDSENPSGVALISVDAHGENCILVAPGANSFLTTKDIEKAKDEILDADILLMQLEIPMETVSYAANIASTNGTQVVLNPAPAQTLSEELLKNITIITPNKGEAEILSGVRVSDWESAKKAANLISDKGVNTVVITLGALGALIKDGEVFHEIEAELVEAVDTTAAGDTFSGTLCVGLAEGKNIIDAVKMACKASAITVTRMGAQAAIPHRNELI